MTTATKLKLRMMLGNYPNTKALKSGAVRSDLIDFDFVEVKVANNLFKQVVRDARYDVAELAIVTYLQAKAYGKPYVLLPAVVVSRGQHHTIAYNPDRGPLKPSNLNGKRVGVRAYTVTTGTWVRGILASDYGVDINKVEWITFEDPHVAEYRDPAMSTQRLMNGPSPAGTRSAPQARTIPRTTQHLLTPRGKIKNGRAHAVCARARSPDRAHDARAISA
jgi:4,5-dihydroxyphthalate decarboxylase